MELKKYVLLENNTIVEFCENGIFGFSYIENKIDGVVFTRSAFMKDVKKTSDNILDFLEVGDLVDTGDGIMDVDGIYENEISLCRDIVDKENVIAIYKRQSNGDYKRYEVK